VTAVAVNKRYYTRFWENVNRKIGVFSKNADFFQITFADTP
jgi:hypothetical protein